MTLELKDKRPSYIEYHIKYEIKMLFASGKGYFSLLNVSFIQVV